MMSIFGESKKLRRFVSTDRIERSPCFVGAIAGESESGQQFAVKCFRARKILHPQINVIQNSCLHCDWIFLITAASSGSKPDFGRRAVSSRQLAPFAPAKTCLKMGSDSSTRFMFTRATACQKRISDK